MEMRFNDQGSLIFTDYWACEHGSKAGEVWVSVRGRPWHILMPDVPVTKLKRAVALPVTARDQDAGWQWKLWLKLDINWYLHIPLTGFVGGTLPTMPDPGTFYETSIQMYGTFIPGLDDRKKVTHNFGLFRDELQVPRLAWSRLLVGRVGKKQHWQNWVMQNVR